MVTASIKSSRVLAVPARLKVVGLSSPALTPLAKPWLRQTCAPLWTSFQVASVPKPLIAAGRGRFNVLSQAVTTTPETEAEAETSTTEASVGTLVPIEDAPPGTLKTKKLTKRVKHIMEILDKEAVEAANKEKNIPDIRPGDVIQLRVEVPENKRRVSLLRGIVIARRNAGIATTFRIRRVIAGVGVEMVFPLYSPNIKEIKVVDKRKVRRAKLFYLRDKIARLSSC
jgi:large subunit ribosomal protein L19